MAKIHDIHKKTERDDAHLLVINPKGEEIHCEILFTFQSEDFGKDYVVYTDNTRDKNGELKVYASIYDPEGKDLSLKEINTRAEWEMIDKLLEEY